MKKVLIALVVLLVIALGAWYFIFRPQGTGLLTAGPSQTNSPAGQAGTTTPPLPTPSLATIVVINKGGNTLTLKDQGGATSTVLIAPSTLIYQNGAPISSTVLKVGEAVAVIFYPPSVGASNVAQSITAVSGQ